MQTTDIVRFAVREFTIKNLGIPPKHFYAPPGVIEEIENECMRNLTFEQAFSTTVSIVAVYGVDIHVLPEGHSRIFCTLEPL